MVITYKSKKTQKYIIRNIHIKALHTETCFLPRIMWGMC